MAYLLTKLMGAGAPAGLAEALGSDSADNKTAIGTSQGTAFETSTAIVRFTTVASGTGCILSRGARGDSQIVINAGANDLSVYPHVGAKINGLSTNAAFVLAAGTWGSFERVTDAQWQAKSDSAANLSFTQSGTGAASNLTVQGELRRFVWAEQFGAVGDGATDDTAAIQAALDAVKLAGGGIVRLMAKTYIVTQIKMRDGVELWGSGRLSTIIKLKNTSNTDVIIRHASDTGFKAALRYLTVNGNDTNNTSGGVYWAGSSTGRGPTITFDDVLITACRAAIGGGVNGAVTITGSTWGVMQNCDIFSNTNAVGLWHKGSDWTFTNLYCATNGNAGAFQNVIIQGGGGNLFNRAYFGGNGGLEQVLLWGAARNDFVGCYNDNAWQHAWRLIDNGGTACTDNRWTGGQTSSPGQSLTNTYNGFQFEGASARNIIAGMSIRNLTATVGAYAINETGTAGNNRFSGCIFGTDFGTATTNLRSGGGSLVNGGDGSAAYPAYGFDAEAGVGWWRRTTSVMSLALGSTNYAQFATGAFTLGQSIPIAFASGDVSAVAPDVFLYRDAANVLALRNANAAQESRVYAGNGGFISNVKTVTESLTIAAAATTVGATSIPAGAILLGVSVRVTTVIPTAATFTVTTTVGGTVLQTAAVAVAAGSTDPGTAAGASYRAAATTVTITPNLTPGAATGVVRLQYYYLQITPPTS